MYVEYKIKFSFRYEIIKKVHDLYCLIFLIYIIKFSLIVFAIFSSIREFPLTDKYLH